MSERPALTEAQRALEAILMVATEAVPLSVLGELLEVGAERVEELLDDLARSYEEEGRGFRLAKVAGGYRFQSHPDLAPYVLRFVEESRTPKLSAAALEALAVVAYRQPVSRAQVSAIRGVASDGVMRMLEERELIERVGIDPGPGQAVLFGTTRRLLEHLGVDRIEDLPPIADFHPGSEEISGLDEAVPSASPGSRSASLGDDEDPLRGFDGDA